MRRSEASRYALWSVLLALALATATGAIYLHRRWVAHVEEKNAPPAPPLNVERQSSGLTFSKVEGDRTVFTLSASKSTDFKGKDARLLEDVKITAFGKSGDRNDVIHTQTCEYAKADGSIQCTGNVTIDLQSAEDAARVLNDPKAAPSIFRVETSAVTFDRATGRAQTSQPVHFSFPNGAGAGLGAVYSSEEGILRLVRDVQIHVSPATTKRSTSSIQISHEVTATGSALEISKQSHHLVLQGPVLVKTPTQTLTCGVLDVDFDQAFHVETAVASQGSNSAVPQITSQNSRGPGTLTAQQFTAHFASEGSIQKVTAEGAVQGSTPMDQFHSNQAEVLMWPGVNQAQTMLLTGNVEATSKNPADGMQRKINAPQLKLGFSGGKVQQPSHIQVASTDARGTLQWSSPAGGSTQVQADQFALQFSEAGKPKEMNATGNVFTERQFPGHSVQTASGQRGKVFMDANGGWSQFQLDGAVRMKDGDSSAEGQHLVAMRDSQTSVLTGNAVVRDATSQTRAAKFVFQQNTGDIQAEGGVISTDLSKSGGPIQLGGAPASVSSDKLTANSKAGTALYTGHARMWQGESVLDSQSIELLRKQQELIATGKVRAVFPQAPAASGPKTGPILWYMNAEKMTYWDAENRALLEKDVIVQSPDQKIRASNLELFFTRTSSAAASTAGATQISKAIGTSGVAVEQGQRRGLADRGEYTAADGKFVLSGGNPVIYDGSEGSTSGHELTFFLADDTIIVDSGNGTRTISKHRVQNQRVN